VVANFSLTMCHARHHHHYHREARRPAEDTLRQDPELRASDAEREQAVTQLREHGAAGRLDVDELEQRIGAAYQARTRGDLVKLLDDLPSTQPAVAPREPYQPAFRRRRDHHHHGWGMFIRVSVLLVAIWALSGADYFWPAWVMAWWAFALLMRSTRPLRTR
jgi:uncharacterized protein DUF1707